MIIRKNAKVILHLTKKTTGLRDFSLILSSSLSMIANVMETQIRALYVLYLKCIFNHLLSKKKKNSQ